MKKDDGTEKRLEHLWNKYEIEKQEIWNEHHTDLKHLRAKRDKCLRELDSYYRMKDEAIRKSDALDNGD